MGVDRAQVRFPIPPSNPDTVVLGVDRAHVVASDATMLSPLLAHAATGRAAASDATGFSPLLAKVSTDRAAALDATGLSPLLANSHFPTNIPTDEMPNGMQCGWSEPQANVVYYTDPLSHNYCALPSLSDTVSLGVDRAHVCDPMPPHNSDTVVLDRAHVDAAGASLPIGGEGVRDVSVVGCTISGRRNQQESTNKNVTRGRSVTKRRIGPVRHSAPNEFPFTDFANKIPVRIMGINVPPTVEHLSDVSKYLWRHCRDGNDDTLRDATP